MQLWSSWLPDLLPQLPDCPTILVEHEVRRAAQAFFEKTRAWHVTLAAVPVPAATSEVTIAPTDPEQSLVRVSQIWYDGKRLDPVTGDALAEHFGDDWQAHTGVPTAYTQETPAVIRLYPIPVDAALTGLVARVAVKPSETSTGLPDDLAVKFRDSLVTGAKGRLMMYVEKPWSNPKLGMKHESDFNAAIDKAHADAAVSFGKARIASRPKWV
jgi:hypothetical protein